MRSIVVDNMTSATMKHFRIIHNNGSVDCYAQVRRMICKMQQRKIET